MIRALISLGVVVELSRGWRGGFLYARSRRPQPYYCLRVLKINKTELVIESELI